MAVHHVGIGQVVVSGRPGDRIDMLGLGSCVGIYLALPDLVVASHCLLDRAGGREGATPGKYVDTAVPHLLQQVRKVGRTTSRLTAFVAGGSQIFSFSGGRPELEIGARNVAAARDVLRANGVPLVFEHTGGSNPRRASMTVGQLELVVTEQAKAA